VDRARHRSFYRIATAFPPPEADYRSASEKRNGAPPPRTLPFELHASWYDGLSCYDTLEAAIRQATDTRGRLGRLIVRYDIPEDAGVTWSQTTRDQNHYDLFGDRQELRRYLVPDFRHEIDPTGADAAETTR
jgi:hypothetical protein